MATPDELRAAIAESRKVFRAAVEGAGPAWEKKPGGEGEDAWSPRQVAEHAIPTEVQLASMVCVACGYPGLDKPEGSYASPAEALEAFEAAAAKSDGRLKYVTDTDIVKPDNFFKTVQGIMEYNASHLRDHAAQIQRVTGG